MTACFEVVFLSLSKHHNVAKKSPEQANAKRCQVHAEVPNNLGQAWVNMKQCYTKAPPVAGKTLWARCRNVKSMLVKQSRKLCWKRGPNDLIRDVRRHDIRDKKEFCLLVRTSCVARGAYLFPHTSHQKEKPFMGIRVCG